MSVGQTCEAFRGSKPEGSLGGQASYLSRPRASTAVRSTRLTSPRCSKSRERMAVSDGFDVGVIGGCGHVGLPLALLIAKKEQRVLVFDVNASAVASVN